jgi:anti-sigma regulatory factor (Ser/Thr protein kinase)
MRLDADAGRATDRFSHEALFYEGPDSFLAGTLPFVRQGLARDEAMLVALPRERVALLAGELGDDAPRVHFANMAELGRNPARIIPAWRDFVADREADGRAFRGIGEPIWADRSREELVECQRHEALLNLAFDGGPAWRLLCPYDTAALPPDVIDEARRSHPALWEDGAERHSSSYVGPEDALRGRDDDLPPPPDAAHRLAFTRDNLSELRKLVTWCATSAGFTPHRTSDLALAATEVATNSILHGGGEGMLAVWREPGALVCHVRDRGRISDPLVGRERPEPDKLRGRGMWLVNQLCDLVEVRFQAGGNVVRFRLAA